AEAVDVELLRELALALQALDRLGDLGTGGDGLDRGDVALAGVEGAIEVGQADAVVPGLAREDEPLELAFPVVRIEHDQLVALRGDREVPEQRPWLQEVLLLPEAPEHRVELVPQQLLPGLAL